MRTLPTNILPPPFPGQSPVPPWGAPFIAIVLLILIGAWLLMPLIRAWARRIEGRASDPAVLEEITAMQQRIAELEAGAMHTQELEERLDFAERLLAQRNDPAQLPSHRTPV